VGLTINQGPQQEVHREPSRKVKIAVRLIKAAVKGYMLSHPDDMMGGARNYVIGRLKGIDTSLFAGAISNNTMLWDTMSEGYVNILRHVAQDEDMKKVFTKYDDMMTADTFLAWLLDPTGKPEAKWSRKDRETVEKMQGFWAIIMNWPDDSARRWVEANISSLKSNFEAAERG
jgi:hypothetical protein